VVFHEAGGARSTDGTFFRGHRRGDQVSSAKAGMPPAASTSTRMFCANVQAFPGRQMRA
jgi:hypothetical protein